MLHTTIIGALVFSAFTAADMLDIVSFSGGQPISVAPDGAWVAYVLPDRDFEWNVLERRSVGYVVVQEITAAGVGEPRTLSEGATRSAFPVWSPDGKKLAFLSKAPMADGWPFGTGGLIGSIPTASRISGATLPGNR